MPLPFPCLVLVGEHQYRCLDVVLSAWLGGGTQSCGGTNAASSPPCPGTSSLGAPCWQFILPALMPHVDPSLQQALGPAAGMPFSHLTAGIRGCSPVPNSLWVLQDGSRQGSLQGCSLSADGNPLLQHCTAAQWHLGDFCTLSEPSLPMQPCSPRASCRAQLCSITFCLPWFLLQLGVELGLVFLLAFYSD